MLSGQVHELSPGHDLQFALADGFNQHQRVAGDKVCLPWIEELVVVMTAFGDPELTCGAQKAVTCCPGKA